MNTVDTTPIQLRLPESEFGEGKRLVLPDALARWDAESVLLVTDKGIEAAGLLDDLLDALDVDVTIHYGTTEPDVADFAELPTGPFDAVVGIGGGSSMDTAKVASILLESGGTPDEYVGTGRVDARVEPLILLPTTSGTGSEVGHTAVVTFDGVKRGISDERLRPDLALVDPWFTYDLPSAITARSSFDAFVHSLESLTAMDYRWIEPREINYQGANPMTWPLSRQALGLLHDGIERTVLQGADLEARRQVSLGSHLAGQAFSNAGLGTVHALASAVGGMTGRPHGECLSASIGAGLRYNRPVRAKEYAEVARYLGVATDDDGEQAATDALIAECDRLRASLGLPGSFHELGLSAEDVSDIVENTLVQERRLVTNPRTVTETHLTTALEDEFTQLDG